MEFVVQRDQFSDAVSFAVKLLPQRPTQPILSGIRITAEGDFVEFATFDYETSARTRIKADLTSSGVALVSGRLLAEIASKLPPAAVTVSLTEDRVQISCGSAKFSLPSMPVEEYPEIPNVAETTGSVTSQDFSSSLSQVVMAASKDDVTPVITGVQFEVTDDTLTVTATDRYRVATKSLPWKPESHHKVFNALVPGRIVSEVAKVFSGAEAVNITYVNTEDRELIAFSDTTKTVTSLLIKGNYPPVQRLFPDTINHYAVVNATEVVEAVARVSLVLEREAAVRFTFTQDGVILDGMGQENAEAHENVECALSGDEMVVSLKPQFLIEGLRATQQEYARIGFTNTDNPGKPGPVLITGQKSQEAIENTDFKYLLQPNLLLR